MNIHRQVSKRKQAIEDLICDIRIKAHERDVLDLPHHPELDPEITNLAKSVSKIQVGDVLIDDKHYPDPDWKPSMVGVVTKISATKVFIKEYRCPFSISYKKKDYQFKVIPNHASQAALALYEEFCKENRL